MEDLIVTAKASNGNRDRAVRETSLATSIVDAQSAERIPSLGSFFVVSLDVSPLNQRSWKHNLGSVQRKPGLNACVPELNREHR